MLDEEQKRMIEQSENNPRASAPLNATPATDQEIIAYRMGIVNGRMTEATPNVVISLINRIERDRTALENVRMTATRTLRRPELFADKSLIGTFESILTFCAQGGVKANILRTEKPLC